MHQQQVIVSGGADRYFDERAIEAGGGKVGQDCFHAGWVLRVSARVVGGMARIVVQSHTRHGHAPGRGPTSTLTSLPGPRYDTAVNVDRGTDPPVEPLTKADFEALARFRFAVRRYLRFSEEAVRRFGLTPQQYQLLLAVKGFPARDWATVGELAERLQLRHHSVVELVNRAQRQHLVARSPHPADRRAVAVSLTDAGESLLARLATLHRAELRRVGDLLRPPAIDGTE